MLKKPKKLTNPGIYNTYVSEVDYDVLVYIYILNAILITIFINKIIFQNHSFTIIIKYLYLVYMC